MRNGKSEVQRRQQTGTGIVEEPPQSVVLAEKGIKSMSDLSRISLATYCDTLRGQLDPRVTTAGTAAGRLALQATIARKRYGSPDARLNGRKELYFCPEDEPAEAVELEAIATERDVTELSTEQRMALLEKGQRHQAALLELIAEKLEQRLPA